MTILSQKVPVDKQLVHKKKPENVLIYNLRRTLPRNITSYIMENLILPNLDIQDSNFILRFYSREKLDIVFEQNEKDYKLKTLPFEVDKPTIKKYLKKINTNKNDIKILLKYYSLNKSENKYYLIKDISVEDELEILHLLQLKEWHITDEEKTRLSDLFEKIPFIDKRDIFFSNMLVRMDHEFFFEHSNEHVPAMMTIEAARQFLIALCHKYLNIPFEGVSVILNQMNVNFMSYLELNYPVKFMGKVNKVKMRKGYAVFIDINVTIIQKNREAASITFVGKSISKDIFKVIRNPNIPYKRMPRFHPRSIFYHNISIRCKDKKRYLCNIIDISHDGFQVSFESPFPFSPNCDDFEFFIHFQEIGFIHGNCQLKWVDNDNSDEITAGFQISEMEDIDLNFLKEAIKRFCYVREDREVV